MRVDDVISQKAIRHALKLCMQELELDELPPIEFIDEPYISSGTKNSFGVFDGKSIKIVTKGRHLVDYIRTMSHELVHWKQKLAGHELDGEDGSDTENAANSIAGIIMRRFGEEYPEAFT